MTGRILIVDSVATNRIVLRVKLAAAFYEVAHASSGAEALASMAQTRPDLVIAADLLCDMSGGDLCRKIKTAPQLDDLQVILIQCEADARDRLAGLIAGADDILTRPVDDLIMLARIRSLLRARNAESELRLRDDTQRALGLAEDSPTYAPPARVALVSAGAGHDMASTLAALRLALPDRVALTTPDQVLRNRAVPADVFVIAEALRDTHKGLALLSDIRASSETRHAAIVYVAGAHQREAAATALDLGANDLMIGELDPQELAVRLQKQIARKRIAERLRANMRHGVQAALTDPLTGLYNRRYALPHLARMAEVSAQQNRPFAVMIADLDHFKMINDRFGHVAGDHILTAVARRLADNLRAADMLARFGGEEFLILMPDTPRDVAQITATRLCRVISETPFALPTGAAEVAVTVSIGVCVGGDQPDALPSALLELADRALYCAKADGRNQALLDTPNVA